MARKAQGEDQAESGVEGPDGVEQLRTAILQSGRSLNQLSLTCGVGRDRLSRFVRGERDLTLAAAASICKALGINLTAPRKQADDTSAEKPKGGRPRKRPADGDATEG
jgi:antitoxin component HigA of HigAB toxin-antitoxin module